MADNQGIKDRILLFIKLQSLRTSSFEKASGLSNGYIKNFKGGIGADKLEGVLKAFPDLNKIWLLTGSGEMLNSNYPQNDKIPNEARSPKGEYKISSISSGKVIPFYDAETPSGNTSDIYTTPSKPVGMIEIGGVLKDSESALRVYGDSMAPGYPSGCVIGLRPHLDSFIEPGSVYVIETTDSKYLKRLYYNKDKSAYRCLSDNHAAHKTGPMKGELYYPEFEIPITEITKIFKVTGVIKRNSI